MGPRMRLGELTDREWGVGGGEKGREEGWRRNTVFLPCTVNVHVK